MARNVLVVAALLFCTSAALGQDYSGNFQGQPLSMQIQAASGGGYAGSLSLGDKQFPFKAESRNGQLQGTFNSQGHDFPFTAVLDGDHLKLTSAGAVYQMDRPAAAANPLGGASVLPNPIAPAAVNAAPQPQPANDGSVPAGYTVLVAADTGRAAFTQKSDATAQAALQSTLADLSKFFASKCTVSGAFADAKDNRKGGAFFATKSKGKDIKGGIFCGVGDKGAAVSIVYDRADAPVDEWNKLIAALPTQVKTSVHNFPDGTGSVELPDGWTTNSRSVVGGVRITGPAGQIVTLGQGAEVVTPDSQLVQMQNQLAANARMMGGPPPPPIKMLIAPYSGPVDALKTLIPQIDRLSREAGGPGVKLEKIIQSTDATANLPNGKASLIYYSSTVSEKGKDTLYRALSQIETYPVGQGVWGVFFTELSAPDSSYDGDILTMRQIAASFKVNDQAVQQVTQNIIQANNQHFAAFEQSMKEKNDAFDSYLHSVQQQQLVRQRCNDDFDEVIRGYRTVEDTSTGDRTSVDLGNVHEVVQKLNEADPGRYKEIPLRDEEDPQPNH